jgi:hypothetical protein
MLLRTQLCLNNDRQASRASDVGFGQSGLRHVRSAQFGALASNATAIASYFSTKLRRIRSKVPVERHAR